MLPRVTVVAPSDPVQEREFQKFYSLICRHLVCLGLHYVHLDDAGNPKGKEYFYAWTCFAVCFHDVWCLVTAGHVVRDFDQLIADKQIKIVSAFFADHFGKDAKDSFVTPVSYEDLERPYVVNEETGADFATILVSDLYRAGFQKNGIIPIPPEVISLPHNDIYQVYVLLGFPKEVTDRFTKPIEPGEPRKPSIVPVMMSVRNIEDYSEIPDTVLLKKTRLPMFVGQLTASEKINIEGMSGGPRHSTERRHLRLSPCRNPEWLVCREPNHHGLSRIFLRNDR
jgi:hypothetical protein